MGLIAAVGDVTGDGRADVLAKNKKTGITRVYPGDGVAPFGAGGSEPLRFARVRRYRPDKSAQDADAIDDLRALLAAR